MLLPQRQHPLPIYDISSLSPLLAELQMLVFDKLTADPALSYLQSRSPFKAHYNALTPRLYQRIAVTRKLIRRGLFKGLGAALRRTKTDTGEQRLLNKNDLLGRCESFVLPSLADYDAFVAAALRWEDTLERLHPAEVPFRLRGCFNNVAHLSFGSSCAPAIFSGGGFAAPLEHPNALPPLLRHSASLPLSPALYEGSSAYHKRQPHLYPPLPIFTPPHPHSTKARKLITDARSIWTYCVLA
ncbi:hypothetical protein IAR50_003167 [Cryptococcus sp. DSM 104548]